LSASKVARGRLRIAHSKPECASVSHGVSCAEIVMLDHCESFGCHALPLIVPFRSCTSDFT
jgi:hypothetical protein